MTYRHVEMSSLASHYTPCLLVLLLLLDYFPLFFLLVGLATREKSLLCC
jgi:hypothetical protein